MPRLTGAMRASRWLSSQLNLAVVEVLFKPPPLGVSDRPRPAEWRPRDD